MNKPNMANEIIESIHMNFEDYPDVEADCYLCLTGLCHPNGVANEAMARIMARAGRNALDEMGRCPKCGTLLENYIYNEVHTELEENTMEKMVEKYCPNCDMKD